MSDLPYLLWLLVVLSATLTGFCGGWIARGSMADRRLHSGIARELIAELLVRLNSLCAAARRLEALPLGTVEPAQWESLKACRRTLFTRIAALFQRAEEILRQGDAPEARDLVPQVAQNGASKADSSLAPLSDPSGSAVRTPVGPLEPDSGLLGAEDWQGAAMELADSSRRAEVPYGVLVIQADRHDLLQKRYGMAEYRALMTKLAGVVRALLRPEDQLFQVAPGRFSVLMPNVLPPLGEMAAQRIRDGVRRYRFRLVERDEDAFLTASFGFSMAEPGEDPDLPFNRALEGMIRSQRLGRNQLHISEGRQLVQV